MCVWCVYLHIHIRSFNQSLELLEQCQSPADRALFHLSFWGLSLLGSFITSVNCCETPFHLSNVFLLVLPFSSILSCKVKKKLSWFCLFQKMPFSHSLSYRDSVLGHLSVCSFCIDCTQISFWIWNVLCLLYPGVCVVAATSASWSHCKKNVLPLLFSHPLGYGAENSCSPMFLPGLAIGTWENVKNVLSTP